jgi:sugar/nucleoside kinase (ribokinase family)
MATRKHIDVLGLGCAAVDDIVYVEEYPPADAKVRVLRRERHCGGLTATALVAAARLGARCAFAGTLGFDEGSEFVLETMRREKIDIRHVVRRKDAGPVRSVIVVDEHRRTRNVFADVSAVRGADAKKPAREVIESARVLFIDHFGVQGNIRAARIARRSGISIVSDFEHHEDPRFAELLTLVDHPIFSHRMAEVLAGDKQPGRAAEKLWSEQRQTVMVTCGAHGVWYVARESRPTARHVPAFQVNAIDTTGCGDVFHGAYAAALARSLPLEERIRFASATAALKATQHGGQAGIPSRAAVEKFLRQQS